MAKYKLLIGILATLSLIALVQITRLSNEVSEYKLQAVKNSAGQNNMRQFYNTLDQAKEIIVRNNSPKNFEATVLSTMEFVHNNSLHKIDKEWEDQAFNIPLVVKKLISASNGQEDQKPHLSCGPRSYAMKMILEQFGITSRLVGIFSDNYKNLGRHRLLEVFNDSRGEWEVWDPDYGVTYTDKNTGQSVDIMHMLTNDLDLIVPVSRNKKGWEDTKTTKLKDRFEATLFESFYNGLANSIIVINTNRFDTQKKLEDDLTINEWARKHYGHPRIIQLPGNI